MSVLVGNSGEEGAEDEKGEEGEEVRLLGTASYEAAAHSNMP